MQQLKCYIIKYYFGIASFQFMGFLVRFLFLSAKKKKKRELNKALSFIL